MSCTDEEACTSSAFWFIYDVAQYHITKKTAVNYSVCCLRLKK